MTRTFKCPSCGAPLEYDGGDRLTVDCPYCSNVVIVPEELRPAKAAAAHPPIPPSSAPQETLPSDPGEIRAKLKQSRRAGREDRRELRHQLRKARRQQKE